jgi:hypothetical protein
MGKPVMHKNASWERENLRFILQPSERSGEYYSVKIPLKISSGSLWAFAVACSLVGKDLVKHYLKI